MKVDKYDNKSVSCNFYGKYEHINDFVSCNFYIEEGYSSTDYVLGKTYIDDNFFIGEKNINNILPMRKYLGEYQREILYNLLSKTCELTFINHRAKYDTTEYYIPVTDYVYNKDKKNIKFVKINNKYYNKDIIYQIIRGNIKKINKPVNNTDGIMRLHKGKCSGELHREEILFPEITKLTHIGIVNSYATFYYPENEKHKNSIKIIDRIISNNINISYYDSNNIKRNISNIKVKNNHVYEEIIEFVNHIYTNKLIISITNDDNFENKNLKCTHYINASEYYIYGDKIKVKNNDSECKNDNSGKYNIYKYYKHRQYKNGNYMLKNNNRVNENNKRIGKIHKYKWYEEQDYMAV